MARLKKTSVYLTQREHAALRHASRLTGRAQSDLIREGVRSVAFSNLPPANTRLGGMRPPPPSDFEIRARVHSVQEGLVATMYQLGRTPAQIAGEPGILEAEVRQVLGRLGIPEHVR